MAVNANWNSQSLLIWGSPHGSAQAGVAGLRDYLGEISSDALLASVAQETTIAIWLPTIGNGPILDPVEDANARLERFELPALQFSPAEAMDLLATLNSPLPPGCGDSVRYWSALARFVSDCIRRQRFYPGVQRIGAEYEAHWRLQISERLELERLQRFTDAMPPSSLALASGETSDPLELIESFISATTDAIVRRAASNDPFFTRVHALANEPTAGPEVKLVSALLGTNSMLAGRETDKAILAEQVHVWTSRLAEGVAGTRWHVGFDLDDPADDASPEDAIWPLTIQMHAIDSDDEPLDAERIWAETSTLTPLGRLVNDLRPLLISELERAAQIFPPLLRITTTPEPSTLHLSTAEAHQFMRQASPELKAQEFEVSLPDWAEEVDRRLGIIMALRPDDDVDDFAGASRGGAPFEIGPGRIGLDSLLRFDWKVSVGGVELSPVEFEDLVKRQSPLMRVRGRWVELDAAAADAAAQFIQRRAAGKTTLGEAFRTAFASNREGAAVPSISLTGTSWVQELLEQLPNQRADALPQPAAFQGTLRPYQLRGLQWLAFLDRLGIGGCLADDMGLGKTIQLIALLLHERTSTTEKAGTTLLFAPTSVVGNWVRELERFAPELRVLLHHGPQRLHGDAFFESSAAHDVVITSYALAHRDLADLQRVPWARLALDEAQKIKNPSAASSLAIHSLSAPRRVALTGTPIENHLSELWSIMDVLNPGLLGSARDFREHFSVPIEKLQDKSRAEHLRRMIRPFVLRRTKKDPEIAGDLPDKIEMKVFCNLTVEQAALYERATAEMLGQIDAATGIRRRGLILAVLTRLKQICNHPTLVLDESQPPLDGRSGKCERLIDMLEEALEEGDKALVFTQYAQMGHLLERMLNERLRTGVHFLHGGTPQQRRDDMVKDFQENPVTRIFVLSLRAGGLGLNLTAASHVFHFDRWWNPAVENQATDRAHRIGQSRQVQVHKFVAIGTVEERIDKLLSEKMELADSIVGAGDEWLTELSTSDLKEYLKLSEQAVGEF